MCHLGRRFIRASQGMHGEGRDVGREPGTGRQRGDEIVELGGIGRLPYSDVPHSSRDPPDCLDDALVHQFTAAAPLGGDELVALGGRHVGGEHGSDLDEELHRDPRLPAHQFADRRDDAVCCREPRLLENAGVGNRRVVATDDRGRRVEEFERHQHQGRDHRRPPAAAER
jgi:hypothetical protein